MTDTSTSPHNDRFDALLRIRSFTRQPFEGIPSQREDVDAQSAGRRKIAADREESHMMGAHASPPPRAGDQILLTAVLRVLLGVPRSAASP